MSLLFIKLIGSFVRNADKSVAYVTGNNFALAKRAIKNLGKTLQRRENIHTGI